MFKARVSRSCISYKCVCYWCVGEGSIPATLLRIDDTPTSLKGCVTLTRRSANHINVFLKRLLSLRSLLQFVADEQPQMHITQEWRCQLQIL